LDRAKKIGEPLLVSLLTVLATEWVLRSRADLAKAEIIRALGLLLEARELQFDDDGSLEWAMLVYEEGEADFAECLMMTHYRKLGCSIVLTFDAAAEKLPSRSYSS
jgi:predicted nucleic-acid-binding protein